MIDQNAVIGLMIPFAGTTAGAAAVMFMRKELDDRVQRANGKNSIGKCMS